MTTGYIMALDVGERRIGIAIASAIAKIASPHGTILNDDKVVKNIEEIVKNNNIENIVVGLPRNMNGQETKQSKFVRDFVDNIKDSIGLPLVFQDESVTSVQAEDNLKSSKKNYSKEDIDAESAVLILQDFIRENI